MPYYYVIHYEKKEEMQKQNLKSQCPIVPEYISLYEKNKKKSENSVPQYIYIFVYILYTSDANTGLSAQ